MFNQPFKQSVFKLVSRLIFSRWAHGYEEHHGACEDAFAAHIGPLHLELNCCFVLDHNDAGMGVRFPTRWGKLYLGLVVCLGEDQMRQSRFYGRWQKPLPKVAYGQGCPPDSQDDFPF